MCAFRWWCYVRSPKTIIFAGITLSRDLVVEAFIWRGCFAAAPPEAATLERNSQMVTIAGHHFLYLWGMCFRKIGLWPRRQELKQGRPPVDKTVSNEIDPLAQRVSFPLGHRISGEITPMPEIVTDSVRRVSDEQKWRCVLLRKC